MDFFGLLKGILRKEVRVPRSFDIVGSRERAVAIVEIPPEERSKEREIADEIMRRHKNVKAVLKKISERRGEYRVRGHELIAGESDTEVVHREYGYLLKLDPQKVYFSPREGTERQRIAAQVRPGELIMLQFAGVCPYAIAITKKQPKIKKIIAIEISPDAFSYMKENIRLNGVGDKILAVLGDVRKRSERWYGRCDRVIMPLPLGAESFLDIAIKCLKKEGGIIHFYNWGEGGMLYENATKLLEKACKRFKKKFKIIARRKVLPYKPRVFKICLDVRIK